MRAIFIALFGMLAFPGSLPAQPHDPYVDSIETCFQNEVHDTLMEERLYDYIREFARNDSETCLFYAQKILTAASATNSPRGYIYAYTLSGHSYFFQGNYKKAIESYETALEYINQDKDKLFLARVHHGLGLVFTYKGDYPKATTYLTQSLTLYETYGDEQTLSRLHASLGILYIGRGEYDKALKCHEKNVKLQKQWKDKKDLGGTYNNIGTIYYKTKCYDKALEYYLMAKKIYEEVNNQWSLALVTCNIGSVYQHQSKFTEAEDYYLQSLKMYDYVKNDLGYWVTLFSLGTLYENLEKYDKAERYYRKCLTLSREQGFLEKEMNVTGNLARLYRKTHRMDTAYWSFARYNLLKDSIFTREKTRQIAEVEEKYESEKKEQQIALLEKDNELNRLEIEKSHFQRKVLIAGLVLVLAVSLYVLYAYRRKRRLTLQLAEQKQEIQHKNLELEIANHTKDKLFQVISHDLRSPLTSIDAIAKMVPVYMEQKNQPKLTHSLQKLTVSVSRVIELVNNLLHWSLSQSGKISYRPEAVTLLERGNKNTEPFESVAAQKNIRVENQIDPSIQVMADKDLLDTVLRNLISNAIKYSYADGIVTLGAEQANGTVRVWVRDNGMGVKPEKLAALFHPNGNREPGTRGEMGSGLGLVISKEFAELNKGEIFVESEPDKGTTITFTVPSA